MSEKEDIATLTERIDNWITTTLEYRKLKKEFDDNILNKVNEINDRCIRREAVGCIIFQQHAQLNGKEKEYKRKLWDSRSFQVAMIILSVLLTQVVIAICNNNSEDKIVRKIVAEEGKKWTTTK